MIRLALLFRATALVIFLSIVGVAPLLAQVEICDNGVDDDNDGLIDLNDVADCICNGEAIVPDSSLVPNHSGEDFVNCPDGHDEIWEAEGWWQVGYGTEDYFYDGCYIGYPNPTWMPYPPAAPIPDGNGFFGCIFSGGVDIPDKKEYLGTCLSSPMEGGKAYSMQFYLGFGVLNDWPLFEDEKYRSPPLTEVALYGHPDCITEEYDIFTLDNIATHPGSQRCPTDYSTGWVLLGTVIVEGEDEWVKARIDFNLPQGLDLNKFMIGATCETHPLKTYYLFDEFILGESHLFNVPDITILGQDPCFGATKLGTNMEGQSYQWYNNGIAINGATEQEYEIAYGEFGNFQVLVDDGTDCYLSATQEIVEQEIPILEIQKEVCFGGTLVHRGQEYTEAGIYSDTLISFYGCDTLFFLEVIVTENTEGFAYSVLCQQDDGEYISFQSPPNSQHPISYSFDGGETFELFDFGMRKVEDSPQIIVIRDDNGCLWRDTVESAYAEIVPLPPHDDFQILRGEKVAATIETNLPSFLFPQWSPNVGISCDDCLEPVFSPTETTEYTLTLDYAGTCSISSTFVVTVLSEHDVYFPNVFSPNNDGINDHFTLFTNNPSEVVAINYLRIFDYWGELVFDGQDMLPNEESIGWDGVFRGELLNTGVFLFFSETTFKDGTVIKKNGTITLIR